MNRSALFRLSKAYSVNRKAKAALERAIVDYFYIGKVVSWEHGDYVRKGAVIDVSNDSVFVRTDTTDRQRIHWWRIFDYESKPALQGAPDRG